MIRAAGLWEFILDVPGIWPKVKSESVIFKETRGEPLQVMVMLGLEDDGFMNPFSFLRLQFKVAIYHIDLR